MLNAFHEAGHAVTAAVLGLEIKHVSRSECFLSLRETDSLEDFLAAACAGGVAAHLFNPAIPPDPSPGDMALVWRYKSRLTDPLWLFMVGREGLWSSRLLVAQDKAAILLQQHWPVVETLARELDRRGYIPGEQAVKIIQAIRY